MRPIWSGAITFGLINIPVRLYSGVQEHAISFDMLHNKDLSPIRFARICKAEEVEVPYKDIVKGYEYQKGEYVVISEEEIAKASPRRAKTIEIEAFIHEDEVDSVFFEKPYFLEPDKGAAKAYLLLNEALKKSKKVALARFVIHTKEHIAIIKPFGRGLIINQLRFFNELRNFAEIELPVAKISPKEMEMAIQLVDQLTDKFQPEKYEDTFIEEIKKVIEEKAKGIKPKKGKEVAVPATQVQDIMKKLKESLSQRKSSKKSPVASPRRKRRTVHR